MIVSYRKYRSKEALDQAFGNKWVYVGRAMPHHGLKASPLGNPFRLASEDQRDFVLQQYREWLWDQIKQEIPEVIDALKSIKPDTVLVCWCFPLTCHAEVIEKASAWLQQ